MNPLEGMALFNLFCDDVRNEEGNKHTYVGCYRSSIVVLNGETELPKLVCLATIKGPASTNLENAELVLRHSGFPDKDVILKFASNPALLEPIQTDGDGEETLAPASANEEALKGKIIVFRAMSRMSDVPVWPGVHINSVLRLNGAQIRGNPLRFVGKADADEKN